MISRWIIDPIDGEYISECEENTYGDHARDHHGHNQHLLDVVVWWLVLGSRCLILRIISSLS